MVNDHCDCFSAAAEAMHKAGGNCTLVHVDSHPDLGIPPLPDGALARAVRGDAGWWQSARPFMEIATWIIPLVAAGALRRMVWIAPQFAQQMESGQCEVLIGRAPRVAGPAPLMVGPRCRGPKDARERRPISGECLAESAGCRDYWLQAGMWTDERPLDARPFSLTVVHAAPDGSLEPEEQVRVHKAVDDGPWVLDFDEDFTSCANPPLESLELFYGKPHVEFLSRLYLNNSVAEGKDNGELNIAIDSYMMHEVFRLPLSERRKDDRARLIQRAIGEKDETQLAEWARQRGQEENDGVGTLLSMQDAVNLGDTGLGLPRQVANATQIHGVLRNVQRWLSFLPLENAIMGVLARSEGYVPAPQTMYLHRASCGMLDGVSPPAGWAPVLQSSAPDDLIRWPWHRAAAEGHYVLAEQSGAGLFVDYAMAKVVRVAAPGVHGVWMQADDTHPATVAAGTGLLRWEQLRAVALTAQELTDILVDRSQPIRGWWR